MKKKYETSGKARSIGGWKKHLKPYGKRKVNKSTRRKGKVLNEKDS